METVLQIVGVSVLVFPFVGGVAWIAWFVLSLPLRRRERARLFLSLVESGIERGEAPEGVVLALGRRYDPALGRSFHRLVEAIGEGDSLGRALARCPGFLPPGMVAMLRAGEEAGRLAEVLPACRRLAPDALSSVRKAYHYLVLLICALTPAWVGVTLVLGVFVLPKLQQIAVDMAPEAAGSIAWLARFFPTLIWLQSLLLAGVWLAVSIYVLGPRFRLWLNRSLPVPWDALLLRLPWQRKRVQRDFSTILGTLLDAGMPEDRSVRMAAACTANTAFERAAHRVVSDLGSGVPLVKALVRLDGFGGLRWRFENAMHGRTSLVAALAGWQEALEAEAFQGEQATAQIVTSALVIAYGAMVAVVAISVFRFFTTLIMAAGV
ncbi:MAG: type II secretion system F family protein [Verrucomicrobiales bacterium]|nr:type II secretion system F family protein [Verrucomicrobiales bacterium]MCP5526135.1 type II secretion system F family protein [Verrucomicrobiales bacterium]